MPPPPHLSPKAIGIAAYLEQHMVSIEGGTFMMGADDRDKAASKDEKPRHQVSVPTFSLLRYPVIQDLWEAVMGENPSEFKGAFRPVEMVYWDDVQEFCQQLNTELGLSPEVGYRLPSEAEWEFAARGGLLSKGYLYAGSNKLKEVGWFDGNDHQGTEIVGLKAPNELGLYDMSGNVWEWCQDYWHDDYKEAPTDGSAQDKSGKYGSRVLRGGSWFNFPRYCRVSYRGRNSPVNRLNSWGFRLARPFPPSLWSPRPSGELKKIKK